MVMLSQDYQANDFTSPDHAEREKEDELLSKLHSLNREEHFRRKLKYINLAMKTDLKSRRSN